MASRTILMQRFFTTGSTVKTLRLYRILMRQALCGFNSSKNDNELFLLQPPIELRKEGTSHIVRNSEASMEDVLRMFQQYETSKVSNRRTSSRKRQGGGIFQIRVIRMNEEDDADDADDDGEESDKEDESSDSTSNYSNKDDGVALWCKPATVKEAIRNAFRMSSSSNRDPIAAYAALQLQQRLWNRTSVNLHDSVRVTAVSQLVFRRSSTKYRYGYRIRMENLNTEATVQLLGRTWNIVTTHGEPPIQVHAPTGGAVGEFPVLEPGCVFEYQSAAEASAQGGRMDGSFYFLSDNGKIEVKVAPFDLVADG